MVQFNNCIKWNTTQIYITIQSEIQKQNCKKNLEIHDTYKFDTIDVQ